MNQLRNKVQLIGHLGSDPEMHTFEDGNRKARFKLATNEVYHNRQGEKVQDTSWHTIIMFGKTADIAERFLTKGSEVGVEGKLTYRTFEDKNKNKKYVTEILASELMLMDKRA